MGLTLEQITLDHDNLEKSIDFCTSVSLYTQDRKQNYNQKGNVEVIYKDDKLGRNRQ